MSASMNPLLLLVTRLLVTCVILAPLQCNALQDKKILMINEQLQSYAFSCASGQLVGISSDQNSTLFYDVANQVSTPIAVTLPLRDGKILKVSPDGRAVAVANLSHIAIIKKTSSGGHNVTTHHTYLRGIYSLVIIKELACTIPWSVCFNIENNKLCGPRQILNIGYGFANVAKGSVYALGIIEPSLNKLNISEETQCLEYVSDAGVTPYDYGQNLWFSYDGSRIFLDGGLTLTSSSDDSDMEPHGDFNSSYNTYRYSYFSQTSKFPYYIAGIRTDVKERVFYYDWPYLNPIRSETIPVPPQGQIISAEEVHICDEIGTTFVIVKYSLSGRTKLGIVISKD